MKIQRWLGILSVALGFAGKGGAETPVRPNILLIYLDDMGWGQPGCYGGTLAPTPSIDALAEKGVRFTNGYVSAPVCGPSRAGLMTGRYPQRTGHDASTTGKYPGSELDMNEVTFGQRMKSAGYVTGIIGKWHLGHLQPEYLPASRGFDVSFGTSANVTYGKDGTRFYDGLNLVDDPPEVPVTAGIYQEKAIQFMESHRDRPWFLYLSLNNVHAPIAANEQAMARFAELDGITQAYAAMISEADDVVGSMMKTLSRLQLAEQTLIFLISDNGGTVKMADMGGLRGRKWLLWEGGIRVPWIIAWEGHITGGQVLDAPVIQLDVLPTSLAAAGARVDPDWQLDGVNLLPWLTGVEDVLEERTLYWRFGVQYAVRQGDWKLIKAGIDLSPMLFNLSEGSEEQNDLSAVFPEKKSNLQSQWNRWNAEMRSPRWEDSRWNGERAFTPREMFFE